MEYVCEKRWEAKEDCTIGLVSRSPEEFVLDRTANPWKDRSLKAGLRLMSI